ncbi:MAG TPA: flagellar hook capping FlgD N-terminal domain-containing protein [Terriglobales bacterium]|nr:flagellar hook capping FlgD N-terminal domain-containing protein [Terriglobales bacterium]
MNIQGLNSTAGTGSTNASKSSSAQETNDMFLKLLTAQLKFQDPIDPVDPNQFVGQLVQFNTLDQLIQIRELVQDALQNSGSAATTSKGV